VTRTGGDRATPVRPDRQRSIRQRILRSTVIVAAVTVLVLGLPLSFYTWKWVEDTARNDLQHRLQRASSEVLSKAERDGQTDAPPLEALRLLAPEGGRLVLDYTGADGSPRRFTAGESSPHPMVEELSLGSSGELRMERSEQLIRDEQYRALSIVTVLAVVSMTAGVAVAAVTAHRVADPVQEVGHRARRLARGDFRTDPARHGITELDDVLDVLDSAADEITARLEREREIVGEVSHQLRSRLTAVRIRLDELSLHSDPEVVTEAEAGLDQVDRLTNTLTEMVTVARAPYSDREREPVDVLVVLRLLIDDFRLPFSRAGRQLTLQVQTAGALPRCPVTAPRLREAVSVLIDNALQHGAGATTVTVGLAGPHTMLLTVTDEGPGIGEQDARRIFDRGYSGGGGSGIGLALARSFLECDGGRLQLQSRHPTTFAVFLPALDDRPPVPTTFGSEPR
jgi:signal transduction histidine kinase